jgi:signal transduction histidine kinase
MRRLTSGITPIDQELGCFLDGVLAPVRWVALGALLLLAIAEPLQERFGWPSWALILVFLGYNLLVELARKLSPWLRSFARVTILDLPMVVLLYSLSAAPGGPPFVLFLLIISCTAASMNLIPSLLYTASAVALVALLAPTLPLWSASAQNIPTLGAQLITMAFVGGGTALLIRRLMRERTTAQASLAKLQQLEQLDQLRGEFIASISHDLRTPITAVRAGMGMLESNAAERLLPEEQHLLGNVRGSVQHLKMLIDDLLTYNQIRAGVLHLDREALDLRSVVAEALSISHLLIREKGQTLEVDLPEPLPYQGDPQRLEQVLVNLLGNASKHTPGGTRIIIAGRVIDAGVRVSVSDTGPGIPPTERETVFQRFYRLDTAMEGSGLGLAIARGIVELHGGELWVEGALGGGATFHMALPQDQNAKAQWPLRGEQTDGAIR